MRRKNLWLRLSSCTMAALIATTSIVSVSAAEVDFQDEASADVAEEAAEEVQEAAGDETEDVTLATGENAEQTETEDAAEAELLSKTDSLTEKAMGHWCRRARQLNLPVRYRPDSELQTPIWKKVLIK